MHKQHIEASRLAWSLGRSLFATTAKAVSVVACLAVPLSHAAGQPADYTKDQAGEGAQVFSQHCASCHGANLQGQAGPALAGPAFAKSLKFSKMSATQLYDFIKTHMPANDPGSLSEDQYLQVLAYVLSKNGYPAGQTPLSTTNLNQIELLPYPGAQASHSSN